MIYSHLSRPEIRPSRPPSTGRSVTSAQMNGLTNTIFLVEDNADDVAALKRALKKANIANPLQTVREGHEAMDYLAGKGRFSDRTQYPLPFLVFLDLKLPRCDGLEILTWIRQQRAFEAISVVVLSGSEDSTDQQKAYALGARSYLVKPPAPDELQRLMKSMQIFWSRFGKTPRGLDEQ